ncbi:MAG: TetR/AcrR family transcriptional regulator [Betaproteobacteria bacterium]
MHKKLLPKIKKQTQTRSELAVQNILQAADAVFDEQAPNDLNARKLAEKSGYSVGTLYYYLNKAEDAFIWMIIKRREKQFIKLADLINQCPAGKPLPALLSEMIDSSFSEYNRMRPQSFFLVFRMIMKFSKNPLAFDDALKTLVEPLLSAQQRDTTGTFRQTDADELLMLLKTCFGMIRRPFLEQSPVAGSEKHKTLALDTMVRLLGNVALSAQEMQ